MIKTITAEELKRRLDAGEVMLIDVREVSEYRAECIAQANLIPLAEVSLEKIQAHGKPIVMHCQAGLRGAKACEKLLALDPTLEIYNLEGGIKAWRAAGLPTTCLETCPISIERQIRILAGSLVVLGVALGVLVHPGFYGLAGFIGAGLVFAGITDWCGMGLFLKKMPWN